MKVFDPESWNVWASGYDVLSAEEPAADFLQLDRISLHRRQPRSRRTRHQLRRQYRPAGHQSRSGWLAVHAGVSDFGCCRRRGLCRGSYSSEPLSNGRKRGNGCRIEVDMVTGTAALDGFHGFASCAGRESATWEDLLLNGQIACYNIYPTADGRWMSMANFEDKFWRTFCNTVGREDWIWRTV